MFPASRYTRRPQGKIELWNQTLKNRILLENYFQPRDLETQIEALIEHYKSPVLSRKPHQTDASRCNSRSSIIRALAFEEGAPAT
jgi:hypothetical protein